ncbi:Peptidoglycan O-acetyltransferase [Rubripirellula lacrimiformis]|uniref:Peptidoglycan O-acetyltransferase n=1 Tax=Rubripirellula lacrimiformis TaxID=1930273 RepID=A0A517N8F4_9BACT|nr:MBOAT family O-acyltransferase [Rubripirellula lacrimiformis]QDT03410.1 Peptidoglycan O-acetyltransferase [Rubripirellula lacrimiformis]
MLFNSYLFWVFFMLVLAVYRLLPHRAQNVWLLVASYVFYGSWDWRFLSLIWISTLVDFIVAQRVHDVTSETARRRWLWLSMATNLGLLGVFKYCDFFLSELVQLGDMVGISMPVRLLSVALPVGISFYTFQTMSYTIDVYRRRITPSRDLPNFALYVCYFPQLVAGPIERYERLMPQIEQPRKFSTGCFQEGLYHVLIGLMKKIVIADNMAPIVNAVFDMPADEITGPECLVAVYAFAFQIYGDFSGYSSIAQGVSKWLGIDLMFNFRMPYFATSPSDFWRRWHISLSQWLRDYLYIPLGGNRGGEFATYRNLMLTMLLGGLWHGAAMTFVAWGLFHGLILCLYRPVERGLQVMVDRNGLVRFVATVIMFHLVCFSWLLFRAQNMSQAIEMSRMMLLDFDGWAAVMSGPATAPLFWSAFAMILFFALPVTAYEWWVERRGKMLSLLSVRWPVRAAFYTYLVFMMWIFPPPTASVFIYFQF